MVHPDLKKAIIDWLFENENCWQRVNDCHDKFHAYIYDERGDYLIGGSDVAKFITDADKLIYPQR